jgi:sugar phosphate isomerase/epimerase
MFKYSYDSLVYAGENVEDSIKRVAKYGYDGLELVGEPDQYDVAEVNRLKRSYGIEISSVCSIYIGDKRDLAHPDPSMRASAIDYVKSLIDMAAAVDCHMVIASPTACGKTAALASKEDEWGWAIESLRAVADYAAKSDVRLPIEAWNRYENYFCNRQEQVKEIVKAAGRPNIGCMGDTFHMNIDEADIASAFRVAGDDLFHVHLADSNRAAPGAGHIDFLPIMQTLKDIGYEGYLSFELLPAAADPFSVMKSGDASEFFDKYTEMAITTMKGVEARLS